MAALKVRSDYFQPLKKIIIIIILDKGRFPFKPYLLCKPDKRVNGWDCTAMVQIHPLTSVLHWLSYTNLIFARKTHFSFPHRRNLRRLNEFKNYFLNDFSQVMNSNSGTFYFQYLFLLYRLVTENKAENIAAFENEKQVMEHNHLGNMVQ